VQYSVTAKPERPHEPANIVRGVRRTTSGASRGADTFGTATMLQPIAIRALTITVLLLVSLTPLTGHGLVHGEGFQRGEQPDRYFVVFDQAPGQDEQEIVKRAGGEVRHSYSIVPAVSAYLSHRSLLALERQQSIVRIEPVLEVFPAMHEDDESNGYQWGAAHIGAHEAHEAGYTGEGIDIAVLDTGVDTDHPYLEIESGVDCTKPDCPEGQEDGNGHGTHVAGTLAAALDSPVTGVAPGATLHAVKVLRDHDAGGFTDDILAGLQWAFDNDVHITNNSYGFDSEPEGPTIQRAFAATYEAGILHVTSAGNIGSSSGAGDSVLQPARYEEVIAVAATEEDDSRRSSSSTGPCLELAAPGSGIESATPGGETDTSSGTSMAAPHVSGVAALIWAENDDLEHHDIRSILNDSATDIGETEHVGHGLVHAPDALQYAADEHIPTDDADEPARFVSPD
jgi:subtilisin